MFNLFQSWENYKKALKEKREATQSYGYNFIEQEKIMGYWVAETALTKYYLEDLMVDILYEASFFGFTQEHLQEEKDELDRRIAEDDSETISAEDFLQCLKRSNRTLQAEDLTEQLRTHTLLLRAQNRQQFFQSCISFHKTISRSFQAQYSITNSAERYLTDSTANSRLHSPWTIRADLL